MCLISAQRAELDPSTSTKEDERILTRKLNMLDLNVKTRRRTVRGYKEQYRRISATVEEALTIEDRFGGGGGRAKLGVRIGTMLNIAPEELSLQALSPKRK